MNDYPPNLFAAPKPDPAPAPSRPRDAVSYRRGSETSTEGALIGATKAGDQLSMYLTKLHAAGPARVVDDLVVGGLTDREAAELLGWERNIVNARRGSKHGRRYAADSGLKRDGGRGALNVVWVHVLHQEGNTHV